MKDCPPAVRSHQVPRVLERLIRLSRSQALIFVLLSLDIAVLGDVVTGPNVWFGPAYLFVMCVAAWCLGWRAGLLTGIGCSALTFAINGMALYPQGRTELLWNFSTRFVAIAIVIALVSASRRAYLREWWRARKDSLTGAFNRQAFFELGESLARSTKWRILLYADLDGLKCINDLHGHSAGDLALKAYAAVVRRNIRRNDLFARVGGDEFLVFLSIKDEESGRIVADRLFGQMNCIPLEHGGMSRCSLGALIIPPGEVQIDRLIGLADALMYRAKLKGGALELQVANDDLRPAEAGRGRREPRQPSFPAELGVLTARSARAASRS
jgi:diguanylate cyclase (GGDEF)-like protein